MFCPHTPCTGGCINSSPAGKRRIATGAELGDDFADGIGDGSQRESTGGLFAHVVSPFTTITALAVAACLLIVTIFVIIFAVLQVNIEK